MSDSSALQTNPARFSLGLRWKVLLGISLTLIPVLAFLTLYARASLISQFEQNQSHMRAHQSNHFLTLVDERYRQMSRLANLIPSLAALDTPNEQSSDSHPDLGERLRQALRRIGGPLDLEWDIRSIHWLPIAGDPTALWPSDDEPLPAPLIGQARRPPEQVAEHLLCNPNACRQYLSSPVLWRGETAGTLVLGRGMASILVSFQQLTGANLAIAGLISDAKSGAAPSTELQIQGATEQQSMLPLLASQSSDTLLASSSSKPLVVLFERQRYEIFRVDPPGQDFSAFVINDITEKHNNIHTVARNSLLIGLVGLLVAEVLLLLIMHGPVERIRALSRLLPLLADNRFDLLAERLPRLRGRIGWRDEIDTNIEATGILNQRMARMQTEREAAQRELRWLADHDPLTALLNRRRFDQELAHAIARASQAGAQGALLFIDLDNFKDVNDTSGHQAGDRLIKRIAKRLAAAVAPRGGRVGRFGGDEFAVLINPAEEAELVDLTTDLQHQIRSTSVRAGKHRHQVSASIGIVLFPKHGEDTQALMANADLAMYQAKSPRHRGHWHLYSDSDMARAAADARVLWTQEIGKALDENRFQLYYQPIMALPQRRVWRAEALLRLPLSDGRTANPAEFIPVAERTGLINLIDRWVIAAAIRALVAQPRLSLAINLSASALADPTLDAELMQLLKSSGIDPQRLTLEITETVAIDNIAAAVTRMNALRALGCRFALDDFGSGFASYAYLKQLPVDDVKIDGSFIRALDHNAEDRIFVKSAAEMAHTMGKKVIAEFVESEAILQVLTDLGVDFAQGYFIGRPQPEPPNAADSPHQDRARQAN